MERSELLRNLCGIYEFARKLDALLFELISLFIALGNPN
jgi:hypothetical protein